MPNENFVEKISNNFNQSATIQNVFGEAVQVGDKTIIPVARIAYGFGGGFGEGVRKEEKQSQGSEGSGAGGGGGLHASAKGVFEITPAGTRFIPASPTRYLFAGLVAGLLLKAILTTRRRK